MMGGKQTWTYKTERSRFLLILKLELLRLVNGKLFCDNSCYYPEHL